MRSFRRGQKKQDISSPEVLYDSITFSETTGSQPQFQKTPKHSPILHNNPQFTPPPGLPQSSHGSSHSHSGSISSPKKLLTPIRNLFSSHHGSSNNNQSHQHKSHQSISSANESLNNALFNTPSTKSSQKGFSNSRSSKSHRRNTNSISSLQFFDHEPKQQAKIKHLHSQPNLQEYRASNDPNVVHDPVESNFVLSSLLSKSIPQQQSQNVMKTRNSIQSPSQGSLMSQSASLHSIGTCSSPTSQSQSHYQDSELQTDVKQAIQVPKATLQPPIQLHSSQDGDVTITNDESDASLVNSESNFQTKPTTYDSDNELDDSDTDSDSSQFSFVRDMRKGRNISVKYYKQPSSKFEHSKNGNQILATDDIQYEEDLSDYDFENNGIDDFHSEDLTDEDVQYNNVFDDENSVAASNPLYTNDDYYDKYEANYNNDFEDEFHDDFENYDLENKDQMDNSSVNTGLKSALSSNSDFKFQEKKASLYDPELELGVNDSIMELKAPTLTNHLPNATCSTDIYSHSMHLSLEGFKISANYRSDSFESIESDFNTDDILESYLDTSKSPSISKNGSDSPYLTDPHSLESNRVEAGSPLVNGLTVGTNLRHRINRNRNNSRSPSKDDTYAQNLFIRRSETCGHDYKDKAVFQARIIKCFHGSLSHDLNDIVTSKVENFQEFTNSRAKPVVGLGIAPETFENLKKETNKNLPIQKEIDIKNESNVDIHKSTQNRDSIGNMMNFLKNFDQDKDLKIDEKQRSSISGMMEILKNIEETPSNKLHNKERKSIVGMMNLLSTLENNNEVPEKGSKNAVKRKSVNDMMNLLANLDIPYEAKESQPQKSSNENPILKYNVPTKSSSSQANPKIYGRRPSDEDVGNRKKFVEENVDQVDEGILDEVNQMPEDYDFEAYKNVSSRDHESGFLRSHSYKHKPLKSVVDNKFQTNKIETLNKTVTFYRSGSPRLMERARSKSLSRAPSTKSTNSFLSNPDAISLKEEDEESSESLRANFSPLRSTFSAESSEVVSPPHLITITEASPIIR